MGRLQQTKRAFAMNILALLFAVTPALALCVPSAAFASGAGVPAEKATPSTELDAQDQAAGQLVTLYGPNIMKIPGVWGVGDHLDPDGQIVIGVSVEQITPEIESRVPQRLGTFRVEIFVGPMPIFDTIEEQIPSRPGADEKATQASQSTQVSGAIGTTDPSFAKGTAPF